MDEPRVGSVEKLPGYRRRRAREREQEREAFARAVASGRVVISHRCPRCSDPHPRAECPG